MSTPLRRTGSLGNTGKKVVAALNFPSGLSAGTGTTVTGGTVSGTTTISPGATQIFVGMTESPAGSGQFGLSADIGGTLLPDTTTLAYTVEARQVADATDMTTYSAIASAFAASTLEIVTEEPVTYGGGFISGGVWATLLSRVPKVIPFNSSNLPQVSTNQINDAGPVNQITLAGFIQAVVTTNPVDTDFSVHQYSGESVQWTLYHPDGTAFNLSGKTVIFRVMKNDGITQLIRYGSPNVVISGASNNIVTVTFNTADTQSLYSGLLYTLWDTTDNNQPLARGQISFIPAANPA